MNDDSLRRAYRDAMPDPASRDQCPTAEELDRLARRDAPDAELTRGFDHVMSCPRCLPEFEVLRSVRSVERTEIGRTRWHVSPGLWLAAAVVVLAVGVTTVLPRLRSGGTDPTRGGETGVALVAPAPAAAVAIPVRLVWRSVPDVDRYEVEVLDEADAIAAATATADTTWVVDGDLVSGVTYRWRVTAVATSGGGVASAIRAFTVRPR